MSEFSAPHKQFTAHNTHYSLHRPILVGVLNVTPDSFSDGGQFNSLSRALERARQMISEGADWLDIGGESSGPESPDVSLEEELDRLLPVIQAIRAESDIWISIDTYKAEVARQCIEAGANVINDITALRGDGEMLELLVKKQVPLIITYSKNPSARTTMDKVDYEDVLQSIKTFFEERLLLMKEGGLRAEQIILDPGMGFYLSGQAKYSFEVLRRLPELTEWGYPLMVGTSRKSFLANVSPGKILSPAEREIPTAVTTAFAIGQGATLLRVHDVAQGRLVLDTMHAIQDK